MRLQGADTLAERLEQFERVITGSSALPRERGNPFAEVLGQFATTQYRVVEDPLRHLKAALRSHPVSLGPLLLVDDLDKDGCHDLFGKLRDDLWELPIQWVVSGTTPHLDPPADSFFDVSVELPLLGRAGLGELLSRRAASGTPQEERLLLAEATSALESLAPCTPRRALAVLRDLYLSDDAAEIASELSRVQSARAALSPTANKVLEALLVHGPAHAGDERLLAEVGVTRSRVVQVLTELEAEGLVMAERVGRRKIYIPRSAQPQFSDLASSVS